LSFCFSYRCIWLRLYDRSADWLKVISKQIIIRPTTKVIHAEYVIKLTELQL
jgi:hypothetical protein